MVSYSRHTESRHTEVGDVLVRRTLFEIYEFVPLVHAAALMVRHGVGQVLVRAGNGDPIGILTLSDIARHWVEQCGYQFDPEPTTSEERNLREL